MASEQSPVRRDRGRARGLVARLAALVLGLAFSLLVFELVLRVGLGFDPRYYDNAGSQTKLEPENDTPEANPFDLPLGMRVTRPGSVSRLAGHPVRINRQGMRLDRDATLAAPPGTLRVMLVGDSVTFSNTALGDGIQARLEADLTERLAPRPVEVLAFACPGWGLRDYAIVIQKAVSRFEIDHLVVNFIMNDVPVEPVELDPDLPRRPTGAHPGATPILRSILRHTAVGTWTHWALKGVLARSGGIDPALVTLALPTPFIRARMELTRPVWVALRDFARSRGIGFTVAFLPYAVQIDADLGRRVVEEWYGERFDPRSLERAPQREWLRICEQERIDCIDAAPAFAAAGDVERLYFPTPEGRIDYIHFSPEGNAVTARVLADRLAPTLADRRP